MHVLIAVLLLAQDTAAAPSQQAALRVFLDCTNVFCDFDYLRTEVAFVNYVRDRAAADVHVLVTGQDAGAGGQGYTLLFIGRERFAGAADTLRFVTTPTPTTRSAPRWRASWGSASRGSPRKRPPRRACA